MKRANATPTRIAMVFVFVALGLATAYWILVVLSRKGSLAFSMESSIPGTILAGILRDFGPAVAAVTVFAFYQGLAGLKQLWLTVARWRVSYWLYLLAFLGPLFGACLVASIGVATGSMSYNPKSISPVHFILVFLFMALVDGPLGEEVGWRGLLLPQLLRKMGPVAASIVVGGVWWMWHVPLYLADGRISKTGEWIEFLIDTLALSVIFTWFFLRSGSSTFLTIVLHATANFSIFLILRNIWHKNGNSMIPNYAHELIIVSVAVAAANSLRRHSSNRKGSV